jgi:uncharacterized protein YbjT (DUF2867 family)
MKILVTGLTGFVGGELAPALLDRGHEVVGLVRDPARVPAQLRTNVEIVVGDALSGDSLETALSGCDSFAWLLHSMESDGSGAGFAQSERVAAETAVSAARNAGVERAIYLGGLVPSASAPSEHLSSRLAVEQTLLEGLPESTALRASIVIGARSRSFRFLVRLIERMPALPLPAWRDHRTAPVDQRDAIAALVAALEGGAPGRSLDIACPETVSYGELVERIAERMIVGRASIGLPVNLTPIAAKVVAAITGEDPELIEPLMGSLNEDLLPRFDGLGELGIRPHGIDSAIDYALRLWEQTEELAAR